MCMFPKLSNKVISRWNLKVSYVLPFIFCNKNKFYLCSKGNDSLKLRDHFQATYSTCYLVGSYIAGMGLGGRGLM